VQTFAEFAPVWNPWDNRFKKSVCHGVGVRTTHENKMQACQHVYMKLVNGSVSVLAKRAHCCKADTTPKTMPVLSDTHIDDLNEQMCRIADDPDTGEITGKSAGGDNDDLACAFLFAMYWSECVMALEARMEQQKTGGATVNQASIGGVEQAMG